MKLCGNRPQRILLWSNLFQLSENTLERSSARVERHQGLIVKEETERS